MIDSMLIFLYLSIVFLGLLAEASSHLKAEKAQTPDNLTSRPIPVQPSIIRQLRWPSGAEEYALWRPLLNQRIASERWRREIRPQYPGNQTRSGNNNTRIMIENWRTSIIGLIDLAERNLARAESNLQNGNYKETIQASSSCTENIGRALIHCFGGKPNESQGQEEPLKMLSTRFEGNERLEFEKAVADVGRISATRVKAESVAVANQQIMNQFSNGTEADQTLQSAKKIMILFKRVITDRYATEIPELRLASKVQTQS